MKYMRLVFIVLLTFLALGCNKPQATPEETDPIYKDLVYQAGEAKKATEEQAKKVEEATLKLREIIPQVGQTRQYYDQYFRAKNEYERLRQKAQYYEVAAKARKYSARKEYISAFEKGEEWPNPKEYSEYQLSKKMRSINLNWRDRYPAEAQKEAPKPKEKASASENSH